MSKVAIVRCKSYDKDLLFKALNKGISLIGGIETIVKENSRVLIKPNLLSARRPEEAVTTHPEFVRAVIRMLKERNCDISVGDSPSGYGSNLVDNIYEVTGIKSVCSQENVNLVKFDEATVIDGIPIARHALKQDAVISLPKFKTHGITVITGAIKNMFGLVTGLTKVEFHKKFPSPDEFSRFIARFFSSVKPTLSIVDGILAMDGEGPSGGRVRNLGLVVMGKDAVSVDSVLAGIANIDVKNVSSIVEAGRLNLGEADINNIEILGERLQDAVVKDFKLAGRSVLLSLPAPLMNVISGLVSFKPHINKKKCTRCNICLKSCPVDTIEERGGYLEIRHDKCINCLCCFEVCTFGAVSIKKSFLVGLISRIKSSENF